MDLMVIQLAVLLALLQPASCTSGYSYVCNPDDSIVVTGLPSTSVAFFAYQGASICATTGNSASLSITGCSKDSPIVLAHGTYVDMSSNQLLGGTEIETIEILCTEVSAAGESHTIADNVAPSVSHAAELTIAPTYTVSSSLNETTVNVGDPILWTITYPSNYDLEITSCSAYPGTTTGGTSVSLITDWCTDTTELLTSFTGSGGTATSVIEAFKFYNNNDVYLHCNLLICPSGGSCQTSCSSGKKRRSSDLLLNGPDAPQPVSAGAYFHIIDPYSSATITAPELFVLLIAALMTLFY